MLALDTIVWRVMGTHLTHLDKDLTKLIKYLGGSLDIKNYGKPSCLNDTIMPSIYVENRKKAALCEESRGHFRSVGGSVKTPAAEGPST